MCKLILKVPITELLELNSELYLIHFVFKSH